jgi:hypothetical protein
MFPGFLAASTCQGSESSVLTVISASRPETLLPLPSQVVSTPCSSHHKCCTCRKAQVVVLLAQVIIRVQWAFGQPFGRERNHPVASQVKASMSPGCLFCHFLLELKVLLVVHCRWLAAYNRCSLCEHLRSCLWRLADLKHGYMRYGSRQSSEMYFMLWSHRDWAGNLNIQKLILVAGSTRRDDSPFI